MTTSQKTVSRFKIDCQLRKTNEILSTHIQLVSLEYLNPNKITQERAANGWIHTFATRSVYPSSATSAMKASTTPELSFLIWPPKTLDLGDFLGDISVIMSLLSKRY